MPPLPTSVRRLSPMRRMHSLVVHFCVLLTWVLSFAISGHAIGQQRYVETVRRPGDFTLAQGKSVATIYVDANDDPGVIRAVGDLQSDITRVTNDVPKIS